ncbi:MAG: M20/M25/M40 family metallo-hydrolase [Clostridiales bacterium]|jgi:carboxypeptidase PM20D1|nr:M20/M25/M40 family metallo-hydrolase [Clostridiales bacterium]
MHVTELKKYFSGASDYNDIDTAKIAQVIGKSITFNTTSYEDPSLMDGNAFKGLHKYFEEAFPLAHSNMERVIINDWTLLYKWKGTDSSKKPVLFMSHLDVVPVMPGTENDWDFPPFSGSIDSDYVWGRGAIDTKGQAVGELYAAEYLLEKGFKPSRDIYFMFGHDEETMGVDGSLAAKEYLEKQGITLEFVIDEGGGFKEGSGLGAPNAILAQVDIFEKGYIDVAVEANAPGGHSSRPGKGTALGKVAKAIGKIEDNPLPAHINPVVRDMFLKLKPFITQEPFKSYVANIESDPKAFADYLKDIVDLAPMVHTTTALTMINGSPAPNVLPQKVRSIINFRIAPEDTCDSILKHCIDTADDSELKIEMTKGLDPSKISKIDSIGFKAIEDSVGKFFNGVTVIPGLVTGGTDCRYFEDICDCCYRFRPFIDNMALGHTTHATNERCYMPAVAQGVKVLIDIMKNTCA